MENHVKPRKVAANKNYTRPTTKRAKPDEIKHTVGEEKTETDRNMLTMFEILSKKKCVKLEHLLLNRKSCAQTVENLFALSFLVKDGRVEIVVDETGSHIVSPRNQPTASSISSGELMKDQVAEGEELMPNRMDKPIPCSKAETDMNHKEVRDTICSQAALVHEIPMVIPLKMYSRKHGMIVQRHYGTGNGSVMMQGCKRKLELSQ